MKRTLPLTEFNAGRYSASLSVKGSVTEKPEFSATFDYMFGLWAGVVMAAGTFGVNALAKPGSRCGENYLKTTSQTMTSQLGDNVITFTVTFRTNNSSIDEASVAPVLTKLSAATTMVLAVLTKFAKEPTAEEKLLAEALKEFEYCGFNYGPRSPFRSHRRGW